MRIVYPADILLPRVEDPTAWSVVACDQFTSQPEYWAAAEKRAGTAPSALRLMLPEAWLGTDKAEGAEDRIASAMETYLSGGIFSELKDSFLYLERTQPDGRIRHGLMAALDLEQYDFAPGNRAPVRATEGTVEERLPPRVKIRSRAVLEMPHTMVLADDRNDSVMTAARKNRGEVVYDFDLMLGGGHITGWAIAGKGRDALQNVLDEYSGTSALPFAVGDGNHSLASAKRYWEQLRETLGAEERITHPARYSLVELTNIHDPALDFEPIHRVIFDTDTAFFTAAAEERGKCWEDPSLPIGDRVSAAESFCRDYVSAHGGYIDYIHGDVTAAEMGKRPGCAAVLLPPISKDGLFRSVLTGGALPRKSFSMGHASDKRYYLECRRIRRKA